MDLYQLCDGIRRRVALELQQVSDPRAREELLLAALNDVSQVVVPGLGAPTESGEYGRSREAVMELLSCIAVPIVKGGDQRGVAALSDLAGKCEDPLLKKRLLSYAEELSSKAAPPPRSGLSSGGRKLLLLITLSVTAAALYLVLPAEVRTARVPQQPASAWDGAATSGNLAPPVPAAPVPAPPGAASEPVRAAEPVHAPEHVPSAARQERGTAPAFAAAAEQVTRVRVVDNQVLVPVLLRNGGATVRLELVLDTGATRTAVHEGVAGRLSIDLRSARTALAEVADGRMIRSRIARIDQLSVGPFSHPSMEIELIPFSGSEGMHDGLLGMDFLARHRFQIDMEHELIRWF